MKNLKINYFGQKKVPILTDIGIPVGSVNVVWITELSPIELFEPILKKQIKINKIRKSIKFNLPYCMVIGSQSYSVPELWVARFKWKNKKKLMKFDFYQILLFSPKTTSPIIEELGAIKEFW